MQACPQSEYNQRHVYEYGDQCIAVNNNANLTWTGSLESSTPRLDLPRTCWTDGFNVTYYNPLDVMFWSLFTIGILVAIYGVTILYYACSKKDETLVKPDSTDAESLAEKAKLEEIMDERCVLCNFWLSFWLAIIIMVIGLFVVLGAYDLPYRQVTCLKYALQQTWEQSASWIDKAGLTSTSNIDWPSQRPNNLPQPCWLNGNNVTFNNPKDYYGYIAITGFSLILSFALLYVDKLFKCSKKTKIPVSSDYTNMV
jgi:hypothetical protein